MDIMKILNNTKYTAYLICRNLFYLLMTLPQRVWWKVVPNTTVIVKWPVGWVVLHESDDGTKVSTESADPNDHYRPWLEKNVGRQGWDWDWDIGNGLDGVEYDHNTLRIKVRNTKSELTTLMALKWK